MENSAGFSEKEKPPDTQLEDVMLRAPDLEKKLEEMEPRHRDVFPELTIDLEKELEGKESRYRDVTTSLSTVEYQREKTAKWLAYWIMGIFLLIVLAGIGIHEFFSLKTPSFAQDFIQKILPVLTGLLGIVFGFYFAKERLG